MNPKKMWISMVALGLAAFGLCWYLGASWEVMMTAAVFGMALPASATPSLGDPRFSSLTYPKVTVSTLATAGNLTLTAAQVLGGLILRDPNGAARTDTLPTAAQLLAAINGPFVGTAFEFTIRNTADAAETITVGAGTGITLSGTATIAQNNSKRFLAVVTDTTVGAEAITVYSLGTVVH